MHEIVHELLERLRQGPSVLERIRKGKGVIEVLVVESQDGSALQDNNYDIYREDDPLWPVLKSQYMGQPEKFLSIPASCFMEDGSSLKPNHRIVVQPKKGNIPLLISVQPGDEDSFHLLGLK